jgi:hypothetical protein
LRELSQSCVGGRILSIANVKLEFSSR